MAKTAKERKAEAHRRALENWDKWRLLLSDMSITYSDLDNMMPADVEEANAALDIYLDMQKKANNQK